MLSEDVGERWTLVHGEPGERVRRYPVHGGWLYQVETLTLRSTLEGRLVPDKTCPPGWTSPVFVPDDKHTAKIVEAINRK